MLSDFRVTLSQHALSPLVLRIDSLPGAMAALVPLPRGLSGDAKLCGDLGPADAEVDGVVDECIELCFRLVPRRSAALEPLQHLCHRPLGTRLRRLGRIRRLVLRLDDPRRPPDSVTRPAPWLRHASSMRDTPSARGHRRFGSDDAKTTSTGA